MQYDCMFFLCVYGIVTVHDKLKYAEAVLKSEKLNTQAQTTWSGCSWAKPIALPATV
jgi:hypothetical protein